MEALTEPGWTASRDPETEQQLSLVLDEITEAIITAWHPLSILISGSFGKGEASVLLINEKLEYLSDIEISVVRWLPISQRSLKRISMQLSLKTGIDIGLYWNPPLKYRPGLLSPLYWRSGSLPVNYFDRTYGSRVIRGRDYIKGMRELSSSDIPIREGFRLIYNRIGQTLLNISLPICNDDSGTPGEHPAIWLYRIIISCQEALLIQSGKYRHSYRAANELLRNEYAKMYPELAKVYPSFPALALEATNFKLNPRFNPEISSSGLLARTQDAVRAIYSFLIKRELGLTLSSVNVFLPEYIHHDRVRKRFHKYPSALLQHLSNLYRLRIRRQFPEGDLRNVRIEDTVHIVNVLALFLFMNCSERNASEINEIDSILEMVAGHMGIEISQDIETVAALADIIGRLWLTLQK